MMELGFYMASTCFATQIASKNLLNKRTLFAKLKKEHLHINSFSVSNHTRFARQIQTSLQVERSVEKFNLLVGNFTLSTY